MYWYVLPLKVLVPSPLIRNFSLPGNMKVFIALNSVNGEDTFIIWDFWRDVL